MSDESASAAPAADSSVSTDTSQETSQSTESTEQSTDGNQATSKASAPKKDATQSSKRKLKLKVDGEDIEEDYDPNDEASIIRNMQLAKVAQKRMQEFASLKDEVVRFVDELRKDPRKVLSDPTIGLDVKKLAAEIIEQEIENSKKSPQQLEKEKLEAELRSIKEEREKEKETAKAQEFERLREQQFERYDVLMDQALQKTDLPKSPYIVKKIADYMLLGLQEGKDVTPEDVIPLVREEVLADLKSMFEVMPEDVVEKLIGKDKFASIRKRNISKAKEKLAVGSNKAPDVGKKGDANKAAGPKKTFKDFFGV